MTEEEKRPSPEALLQEAEDEKRGKLKIFLGAAPGVGKTYSMLSAAKVRLSEGVDVVIGIVETHRRSETQALANGIEAVPRQNIKYRGLDFEEMDVDAILKRKPKLVLIDELAHTNIPGARHPKRYQDMQEILEAGIDVYSTLNVQHIDSLNDVVTRITGVKVKETIPDSVVRSANAIELIDLPPDELLQRLKEGKVYIPEQARLAVNRFFTPGNLTALRELALRQAAERVDDQMSTYMRRHAIAGPWPASNRMMVCIKEGRNATSLVRTACRNAEKRQAPWMALHVLSRDTSQDRKHRGEAIQAMELAESMGAETMTITGEDIAGEIIRIARERNVSTIIAGKPERHFLSRLLRPSTAASILKKGAGFDILLVDGAQTHAQSAEQLKPSDLANNARRAFSISSLIKIFFVVGFASIVALFLRTLVDPSCVPFIYLSAMLFIALDMELMSVLLATALSVLAQDAMLAYPHFSLLPTKLEDGLSLGFFVAISILIGITGDRLQQRIRLARSNAERAQSLYDFTKSIAAAATLDDVAQATVRRVSATLGSRTAILLSKNDRLEMAAAAPTDIVLDTASNAAMDWAWRHRKPAGFKSDTLPGAEFYGMPLLSGGSTQGVLAIQFQDGRSLSTEQSHFLASMAYQAAAAIERARLVTDVAQARLQSETEKLRASLLSSISHDLRAPMDSIKQTAEKLDRGWNEIFPDQKRAQVIHIRREANRLDRFIENLLDMTELVTENIKLNKQPTKIRMLINQALERLSELLSERIVNLECSENLPSIDADSNALTRVFVNIIENACSYSTPDQPINITARRDGKELRIAITDRGPGIPENERQRVFDMFYRINRNEEDASPITGVGLGLSICRGFVEAHRGRIRAQPGENGTGTSIVINLPISTALIPL